MRIIVAGSVKDGLYQLDLIDATLVDFSTLREDVKHIRVAAVPEKEDINSEITENVDPEQLSCPKPEPSRRTMHNRSALGWLNDFDLDRV